MMDSFPVYLYVYDLSRGVARALSPGLIGRQIDGIWHTSVVVYGEEWFFGQGISCTAPGIHHYGAPIQKVEMGQTELPRDLFLQFLHEISSDFRAEHYHLLDHNCNNFTDRLCQFLVGKSIPSHISNLPQDFLQTPFGQTIRPVIDSMFMSSRSRDSIYSQSTQTVLNPPTLSPKIEFHALHREAQTPYQITELHPSFWEFTSSFIKQLHNQNISIDQIRSWIEDPILNKSNLSAFINDNLKASTENNWIVLEVANVLIGSSIASSSIDQELFRYLNSVEVLSSTSDLRFQGVLKVYLRIFAHALPPILLSSTLSQVLETGLNHSDSSIRTYSIYLSFNLSRRFFLKHSNRDHLSSSLSSEHQEEHDQESFVLSWFSGLIQLLSTFPSDPSVLRPLFHSIFFCLQLGFPSFRDLLFCFLNVEMLHEKKQWFLQHGIQSDVLDEFYFSLSD